MRVLKPATIRRPPRESDYESLGWAITKRALVVAIALVCVGAVAWRVWDACASLLTRSS